MFESGSIISSKNQIVTMNTELNPLEHGTVSNNLTPNKRKDKFLNQTLEYINHAQISPINSHVNATSSRIHSLFDQNIQDSNNRVRIID